ncbi:DEAD/DEAH box helicase [Pseudarthrobacter raffinosi]|uniref:DEAD/DEAH box helicase n=1 Tax=Pseudarthrobacter raffinosi TaxID=2953651 RepID=UPI00208E8688|nr:DEAD/DEAH box helicase family protein [Pseudarthrobacter sp. MDT3-9]MCO4250614.1 DEAD/DEAH box helicase family protein [Pseudarthrobacter sp. MDT3-9]
MVVQDSWAGTTSSLSQFVAAETASALNAYRARPDLVREHSNIEAAISQGGYGRKQLNELVQNAADAIKEPGGRIRVVLAEDALYCANEGQPFTEAGFRTLMLSHSSEKRDDEIGRFGLGFKSVIQVTAEPRIFSRSGSVSWSQDQSRNLLEDLYPGLTTYPILRLATPVDPDIEAAKDAILSELFEWATTVVKLPLSGSVTWLSDEMKKFPEEFLLFSDKIGSLEFEDRAQGSSWTWTAARDGSRVSLYDGASSSEWLIFKQKHEVSAQAAVEAGSIVARQNVDVTWAVPLTGNQRRKMGRFWNYFPTQHETSLRGIVNAAFKMNEDRHSMLETLYNREILTRTLPRMVASALNDLRTPEDPALFLDILPSRDKESSSWADSVINKPIFEILPFAPCLPDRSGVLRLPSEIKVQPALEEATRLIALWDTWVPADRHWLHSSALRRESQVIRILKEANFKRASIEDWLEEVVAGGELQDYENALQIAAMIDKSYTDYRLAMRRSRIVLMSDGSVQPPITSRVFLPMKADDESANVVSYELMHHGNANAYLRALDLHAQDGRGIVNRVASDVAGDYRDPELAGSLWRLTRSLSVPESLSILSERTEPTKILVRCRDHMWRTLGDVWLPGSLIPQTNIGDEHLLVDDQFHAHDLALLRNLGARTSLEDAKMVRAGGTYLLWKGQEANRFSDESRNGPVRLSEAGIRFSQALTTDGLNLLADASAATRAKVTRTILGRPQYPTKVEFSSGFRTSETIDGPDLWWVKNHGAFETPLGLVDTKHCLGNIDGIPTDYLPFPGDEEAKALGLPTDTRKVQWSFVLSLAEQRLPILQLHELYGALAVLDVRPPKELLTPLSGGRNTRYLTSDVILATELDSRNYLVDTADVPVIYTGHPDLDEALAENWGLKPVTVEFHTSARATPIDGAAPESIKLKFPFLKRTASEVAVQTLCVPCTSVDEVRTNSFDSRSEATPKASYLQDGVLYYRAPQGDQALLTTILGAFGSKRASGQVMQAMRQLKKDDEAQARIGRVNKQKTDAGKIAELVGRDTLRKLIPDAVMKMLDARELELTDERLFEIVSNLHGSSLLKVLKPALSEAGIEAPEQFRGGRTAQEFVRELGFSPAMAGESIKKKPEREEFVGPVGLNPLHQYQETTSKKIVDLLAGDTKHSRGLVQLPTGAGKTRVAVESVIRDIRVTPQEEHRLVVWIAQSEELCEQAIETWTYVWQAAGVPGERMAVSRLWGGNSAVREETKLHLVVATIQTLASIQQTRRSMYEWMSNPDLVIIDEAHGATATSYTPVLSWFGRSFTEKSRSLLGLSATPYRGTNEKETERLVARFGRNLIEPDEFSAENAHEYLQGMGVLAQVKHRELKGIELKLKDMRSATDEDSQSAMLEARIDLQHVADSTQRNEAILDHIKASETKGPTLVFAASVEHAEALAAVLSVEGIPAAAISGKTDLGHRRSIIEDFRNGKIRVLTNFDVLTQGFDAPKVDAVYVCRPTFSPNKYIQMIGRGLRGPLNGGSQEVLIVNVKDNLDQYGDKLAFTQLDHLWKDGS